MIGASREALVAGRQNLESLTDSTSVDAAKLAEELTAVTALLDREVSFRRVLTDPSRSGQDKAQLVTSLLSGQVSGEAVDLVSGLVRSRWSGARDLVDAVEELSSYAEVIAAEKAGALDDVEDELFRFGRVVSGSNELRSALTEPKAGAAAKAALIRKLLGGRANAGTVRLVTSLVNNPRGRSLEQGLESYSKLAAARRGRVVALVTTAVPLSDSQKERLSGALGRLYGRQVHLNIDVDPEVVGGVRVQIGDEIIEGTVSSRLEGARQSLEG
ncbi:MULTISPECIES: F0F1 ATP synthase subunit delta [unclassified Streptomyces]|uniref:F0F1 ATP synthase subunit delta n=1 Tax=Streptomycetaceae TaxID=2062 RepID=UPI002E774E2A|nr:MULTISPECIES: F0F1 ATP synthase subunit delta [unclassified Streptomyces]MED7949037.1 F0F1 ATP synthase subunit delta [Streptomyces sp. BE303]MEE1826827.1 F0F1 ATP synthase subunit delta [Streptomyces sp. BE20]